MVEPPTQVSVTVVVSNAPWRRSVQPLVKLALVFWVGVPSLPVIAGVVYLACELRQLGQELLEVSPTDERDRHGRLGKHGGGASRYVLEQRDLAQVVAGAKGGDDLVTVSDFDLALEDDEELVSLLSFLDEQLSFRFPNSSREACDVDQFEIGE